MSIELAQFHTAKTLLGFRDEVDGPILRDLAPVLDAHGPAITEQFYAALLADPETAPPLRGRLDRLKASHRRYLASLLGGDYGPEYFASRVQVGRVHVKLGIQQRWVEAVMNHVRVGLCAAIQRCAPEAEARGAQLAAVLRVCDLDLLIINLAYAEERIERLTEFIGHDRQLVENLLQLPPPGAAGGAP